MRSDLVFLSSFVFLFIFLSSSLPLSTAARLFLFCPSSETCCALQQPSNRADFVTCHRVCLFFFFGLVVYRLFFDFFPPSVLSFPVHPLLLLTLFASYFVPHPPMPVRLKDMAWPAARPIRVWRAMLSQGHNRGSAMHANCSKVGALAWSGEVHDELGPPLRSVREPTLLAVSAKGESEVDNGPRNGCCF